MERLRYEAGRFCNCRLPWACSGTSPNKPWRQSEKRHNPDRSDGGATKKRWCTSLICAKPEDGDIHEDVAAERLARALSPRTVAFTRAATGRVNIRTLQRGIIRYDRALIRQLNEIDEAITFALVQHNQLLDAGQMAATLKIIPFFVAESSIIAVENLFVDRAAFSFHALRQCNFGLIQTRLAGQRDRCSAPRKK